MTTRLENYSEFFAQAFFPNEKKLTPFDYQSHLAEKDLPSLLNVPTGAGKTNAILGAWLWRRAYNPKTVGRRLIYCLPMRTLVEQTRKIAEAAVKNLRLENRFSVHTLYGGDVSDEWDIYPERETIIIGTQDLLLSRALNRGYAMNRFRWAFHFGLFNNDCLWVFDEVQLFGDGLATTAQLAAMREKFETFGTAKSLWMSATLDKEWLKTVDFVPKVNELQELSLTEKDRENEVLKKRLNAVKGLQKAEIKCRLPKGLAEFIKEKHETGTQTLVVVNTVQRAQEIHAEIEKLYPREKEAKKSAESMLFESSPERPEIKLLHSRFRPAERKKWQEIFEPQKDESGSIKSVNRIIIATQVVEAGVDISSKLLITDLAPFASLVQRFGRSNRQGEFEQAEIFWVDLPLTGSKEKFANEDLSNLDEKKIAELEKIVKPYEWQKLASARKILETLESASPSDLEKIDYKENYTPNHVLRCRDIVDLFDTTPDLSGFDLDVSRFVRGGEERDVSVYWRDSVEEEIKKIKDADRKVIKTGLNKKLAPRRDELCSVKIYDAKNFLGKNKRAWTFDALSGEWRDVKQENLRTGMIILLDPNSGGYDSQTGWNPKVKKVEVVPLESQNKAADDSVNESYDDDERTFEPSPLNKYFRYTQTLAAHSREAKQAAERILAEINLPELGKFAAQIISAAHHHDLGKAHQIFQATVHKIPKETPLKEINFEEILAKAKTGGKHRRKKFRHELASALALLETGKSDLEVYLAASHHGKVRLSIRALPDETKPFEISENGEKVFLDKKFARGIWDDDKLPEIDLGDGVIFPTTNLNLMPLELGRSGDGKSSWLERMLRLRDELGIFRLAYLEAIVRAADVQASACPQDYFEKGEVENDK